jgi:hypothetical protein
VVNYQPVFFVDLDETLIHSVPVKSNCLPGRKNMRFYFVGGYQTQSVAIHPEAYTLLEYLRGITKHVYMLTVAVKPYAHAANKVYNLGFKPSQIFDRHIIHQLEVDKVRGRIKDCTHALLIDNLPSSENTGKTKFIEYSLDELRGVKKRYIRVNEFYPGLSVPWEFDFVREEIEEALK